MSFLSNLSAVVSYAIIRLFVLLNGEWKMRYNTENPLFPPHTHGECSNAIGIIVKWKCLFSNWFLSILRGDKHELEEEISK